MLTIQCLGCNGTKEIDTIASETSWNIKEAAGVAYPLCPTCFACEGDIAKREEKIRIAVSVSPAEQAKPEVLNASIGTMKKSASKNKPGRKATPKTEITFKITIKGDRVSIEQK